MAVIDTDLVVALAVEGGSTSPTATGSGGRTPWPEAWPVAGSGRRTGWRSASTGDAGRTTRWPTSPSARLVRRPSGAHTWRAPRWRKRCRAPRSPACSARPISCLPASRRGRRRPAWWARVRTTAPCPGPPEPAPPALAVEGSLVHGWPPGSPAGQLALGHATGGNPVTALAVFDPDRLGATITRRRALACGLSPALAAAFVAAGTPRRHDLSSVAHVLLSGPPSPGLRAALATAFPGAALVQVRAEAAAVPAGAPLGVSQEGMVWHEQFARAASTSRAWSAATAARSTSPPWSGRCRRWSGATSRCGAPSLVGGVARQVVGQAAGGDLAAVDLTELTPRTGPRPPDSSPTPARRPFDLSGGPLFEPSTPPLRAG